ncbi:hypothetical protein DH2020_035531 [Rehmannia glutinosa]|uniref:Annexin n=1 Tax=Rehmannia glutinosa TaxID=99300 RepID=A0ABR0V835_REHGL
MSTLCVPSQVPSVAEDCEQLHKAFSGWGTNEGLIISILGHRNAAQRKLIREVYAETYGEDLLKSLDKELTNDFERVVMLWTLDPPERDVYLANEATKRWTSSNQVLVEIACTRSPKEQLHAREAYHVRFKRSLEEDVAYHTSGDFRKFIPLWGDDVNLILAKSEAKLLHEKICEKAYSCGDVIGILSTRAKHKSTQHSTNTKMNSKRYKQGSESRPKDEFLSILRSTVKCLVYPEKYFEKVVRLAINRRGTDEGALTRVVATQAEVDMKIVKDEYQRRNSVPLDRAIAKDTNGDYEKMLLALIGHEEA